MASVLSQLSVKAKTQMLLAYDLHAENLRLDRIAGRLTPDPVPVNEEYGLASVSGDIPDISFLVATTDAGLLLFEGPRARRLFRGRDFYGITTRGGRWYTFHRVALANGCIISFRLEHGRAVDARVELAGLMRGVHQIDFIDGCLWIVDTFHDRVMVVPVDALSHDWRRHSTVHYPIGRSGIGREQPNHAHFNSVLGWDGGIYLVAHNHSVETGQESELFLLDADGTVQGRETMGASDCHNIGLLDGERIVCRSMDGAVCLSGQDVLRLDGYVRGLALGDDFQIVGTSTAAGVRARRADGSGSVVVTDRGFRPLGTINLPRTQVYEVRRVDVPDLGLSAMQRLPVKAAA